MDKKQYEQFMQSWSLVAMTVPTCTTKSGEQGCPFCNQPSYVAQNILTVDHDVDCPFAKMREMIIPVRNILYKKAQDVER